jgi:hypothetical protein
MRERRGPVPDLMAAPSVRPPERESPIGPDPNASDAERDREFIHRRFDLRPDG